MVPKRARGWWWGAGGDVRGYLADKICEWSLKGHLGNGYQHMEYAGLE